MKQLTKSTLATLAVVLSAASLAEAQSNSGSITATAVVQQALNVTPVSNLNFANVFPGISKTIAVTDAGAGRLDVAGAANTLVNISFTALPSNLVSGGSNLPIGTYTGLANTSSSCTSGSGSAFSPGAGATATLNATGGLCVFVGATVSPPAVLSAGTYTGTITMQVLY